MRIIHESGNKADKIAALDESKRNDARVGLSSRRDELASAKLNHEETIWGRDE